jgi:hypothetical protein
LPELLAALRKQPLIVGCDWNSEMDTPAPDGLVSVGGKFRGGHEFALLGFDMGPSEFTFLNSWSSAFGVNGRFKVMFDDFVNLLAGDASAVNAPTVKPA